MNSKKILVIESQILTIGIWIIGIFIFVISFESCYKKEDFNFIKFETVIQSETIKKIELDRGVIKLNRFYLKDNCEFIYKDTFPTWIKDLSKPDFSFNEYKFTPSIYDIEPTYVIFKKKNDSLFYIIKYKDTLKFKIIEF